MKTLLLSLLLSVLAFGQELTNDIYWASQPPEIQALRSLPDASDARAKAAEDLAKNGFRIDVPIMVWAWDAFKVMKLRSDFGYTWVPSALMPPVTLAPGLAMAGNVPYDPNAPPPGSIKVSTDSKDFPPFVEPVKPKPVTEGPVVGPQSIGNLYLTTVGDKSPADTVITEPRGKFVKRVRVGPFGAWAYWEKL